MNIPRAKLARRNFLLAVAAGATGAASLAVRNSAPGAPPAAPQQEAGRGYQLSAHVRKYYRTARI